MHLSNIIFLFLLSIFSFTSYLRNLSYLDEVTLWLDVIDKSQNKWRPHFRTGLYLYLEQGNINEAIVELNKASSLKPNSPDIHNNIGLLYQRKGWKREAAEEYNHAIRLNPALSEAYLNLGTIYMEDGRLLLALNEIERALLFDPYSASAYINKGFILSDMGNYKMAENVYKIALSLNPYDPTAYYGLGLSYEGMGLKAEALKHWQEFIRLAPPQSVWVIEAKKHMELLK